MADNRRISIEATMRELEAERLSKLCALIESNEIDYIISLIRASEMEIIAAVNAGRTDLVNYLLNYGANVETLCGEGHLRDLHGGTTLLAKAARNEDLPMVELLLSRGASIALALQKEYKKFKYFERSWQNNQIVKTLLDYAFGTNFKSLSFLEKIDISGFNLIDMTVNGERITREMLVAHGFIGAENALVTMGDLEKLHDITRRDVLMKRHAARKSELGKLINPADTANSTSVSDLTAQHADIDAAIMNAARLPGKEGTEILGMLLEINAGAMIKRSALSQAITSGNASSAFLLLPVTDKKDQKASLFRKFDDYCPWYALMMYDAFEHKNVIELLAVLKSGGADFNYCIRGVRSLLDSATSNFVNPGKMLAHTIDEHFDQTFDLINFLVDNGADVRRNSCGNNEPLHILLSESSVWVPVDDKRFRQLFEYFIQQGADVNAIGSNGKTPLQIATESNHLLAISILTAHGANNESDNQVMDCEESPHKLSRLG